MFIKSDSSSFLTDRNLYISICIGLACCLLVFIYCVFQMYRKKKSIRKKQTQLMPNQPKRKKPSRIQSKIKKKKSNKKVNSNRY